MAHSSSRKDVQERIKYLLFVGAGAIAATVLTRLDAPTALLVVTALVWLVGAIWLEWLLTHRMVFVLWALIWVTTSVLVMATREPKGLIVEIQTISKGFQVDPPTGAAYEIATEVPIAILTVGLRNTGDEPG